MIGSLQWGSQGVRVGRFSMKQAVGEGSADALMEEHEHEGEPDTFFGEAVRIAMAVALE